MPSDLALPKELNRRPLRSLVLLVGAVAAVVAAVTLLPGLGNLRARFAHATPGWMALALVLELGSCLSYVLIFRSIFCRRMGWGLSYQIGMAELGANALFPAGGAGGLALGAWALRRGGMAADAIARGTVAFFLLTSAANFFAVILVGIGLASGALPGNAGLGLTLGPALAAALAVVATCSAERVTARLERRLLARRDNRASRVSKALHALSAGVGDAVARVRERDWRLLAGSAGYLVFDIMVLWASFRAFGSAPRLSIIWMAYLIGQLGGLIPIPGGIGGVDVGLVGALVLYGAPVAPATAAVLAYRAVTLWVPAAFGAEAFFRLRRTLRNESDRISLCQPGTEMEVLGLGRAVIAQPGVGGE